jgi:hypothetical protein
MTMAEICAEYYALYQHLLRQGMTRYEAQTELVNEMLRSMEGTEDE